MFLKIDILSNRYQEQGSAVRDLRPGQRASGSLFKNENGDCTLQDSTKSANALSRVFDPVTCPALRIDIPQNCSLLEKDSDGCPLQDLGVISLMPNMHCKS